MKQKLWFKPLFLIHNRTYQQLNREARRKKLERYRGKLNNAIRWMRRE